MAFYNNVIAGASGAGSADAGYKIERSLRFNSGDSAKLSRNVSSAGNRRTWTWSGWAKRSSLATEGALFSTYNGSHPSCTLFFQGNPSNIFRFQDYSNGNYNIQLDSNFVLRDTSAWYHFVVALDTTQNTTSDRVKIYINGVLLTSSDYSTATYPGYNHQVDWNNATAHDIGRHSAYFDGYIAEVHFVDGQQLAATDFGEFDATTGAWNPKRYSGTYGSNGFYLDFSDNSSNAALGTDSSGNNNTWTVSNLLAAATGVSITSIKFEVNSNSGGQIRKFFIGSTAVTSSVYTTATNNISQYDSGQGSGHFPNAHDGDEGTNLDWKYGNITYTFTNKSAAYVEFIGNMTNGTVQVNGTTYTPVASGTSSGGRTIYRVTLVDPANVDSLLDSPTNYEADSGNNGGNYCTFNPVSGDLSGGGVTMSNGNLEITRSGGSNRYYDSTMTFSSGKWYWEMTVGSTISSYPRIGIWNRNGTENLSSYPGQGANGYVRGWGAVGIAFGADGDISSGLPTFTANDTLMFAMDLDNGKIWFGKNGTWYSTGSTTVTAAAIAANTATARFTDLLTESTGTSWTPIVHMNSGDKWIFNPGSRSFLYTPPSGFKSLCTQNLPNPLIADPSRAFDVKTWQGNGVSNARTISGFDFSPDFVWGKTRTAAYRHMLYDTVRGVGKDLRSDTTAAEGTNDQYGYLSAFNSDGFSTSPGSTDNDHWNHQTKNYVAWAWDGGDLATNSAYDQSQVWSDGVSATRGGDPATHAFDGKSSTNAATNSSAQTWTVSLTGVTSMQIRCRSGNGSSGPTLTVSGTGISNLVIPGDETGELKTLTVTSSSVSNISVTTSDVNALAPGISQVYVNGKLLVDAGLIPVGSLNSSVYNQGSTNYTTSQVTGNDYSTSFSATNGMFNGQRNNIRAASSTNTFTWTTSIALTTLRLMVHKEGGTTSINITDSNGQRNIASLFPTTSNSDVSNGNLTFVNVPVSGTLTEIEVNADPSGVGYQAGIAMVEIDGKILVDNGVTPPNVPSIASTVRANPTAGFSIVTYTGTGSSGTVNHGLNAAPEMIILKDRNATAKWKVLHIGAVSGSYAYYQNVLHLDTDETFTGTGNSYPWGGTAPTSSVFSVGNTSTEANRSGSINNTNYVAYCFAPVEGYSSFGSYTGNGNADGPFTYTGFKVRWVLIKNISDSAKNWRIYDTAINPSNVMDQAISVNTSDAQTTTTNLIDSLSNGFKCRGTSSFTNASGKAYIYAAFAENPFKYARAH